MYIWKSDFMWKFTGASIWHYVDSSIILRTSRSANFMGIRFCCFYCMKSNTKASNVLCLTLNTFEHITLVSSRRISSHINNILEINFIHSLKISNGIIFLSVFYAEFIVGATSEVTYSSLALGNAAEVQLLKFIPDR